MRMGSLAHNFQAIWYARVGAHPAGHRRYILAALCLCIAMGVSDAPVQAQESQSRCVRIGEKWATFWNAQEIATASDVFTQDIVYEDVALGVIFRGIEEFQGFAANIFATFPQATFTVVNSSCSGQQGFLEWVLHGLDGPPGLCGTGKTLTFRGVSVIELKGNRISRNADFWDLANVLRQLLPEGADCVERLLGLSPP